MFLLFGFNNRKPRKKTGQKGTTQEPSYGKMAEMLGIQDGPGKPESLNIEVLAVAELPEPPRDQNRRVANATGLRKVLRHEALLLHFGVSGLQSLPLATECGPKNPTNPEPSLQLACTETHPGEERRCRV